MARAITSVTLTLTADASGDATATTSIQPNGFLYSIYMNYGTFSATGDTTITESGGASRTFLTLDNTNTDKEYIPRALETDTAGADGSNSHMMALDGHDITVTVANADEDDTVTATIYILET